MAEQERKRPLMDDLSGDSSNSDRHPLQKRPRYPKGKKKVSEGDATASNAGGGDDDLSVSLELKRANERRKHRSEIIKDEILGDRKRDDASSAASELRVKRRNQIINRRNQIRNDMIGLLEDEGDVSAAEVRYKDKDVFEDEGVEIEPFNLKQEREEGYFDAHGNFVEYAGQKIKDAWLDSLDVDSSIVKQNHAKVVPKEEYEDFSSEDIGKKKRRIANLLHPGETIMQALKRLKGTPVDTRERMSETTQRIFDQLTEDAMKLMENGEYDVYHETRENFVREAEGYECLSRARDGPLEGEVSGRHNVSVGEDIFSDNMDHEAGHSSIGNIAPSTSEPNVSAVQGSSNGGEVLDMFGEDDENVHMNLQSDGSAAYYGFNSEQMLQPTVENFELSQGLGCGEAVGGGLESDYVYDQATGYYYSSNLGYYYDPASGLFCCATSGTWYSFDENTGTYCEIQNAVSTET